MWTQQRQGQCRHGCEHHRHEKREARGGRTDLHHDVRRGETQRGHQGPSQRGQRARSGTRRSTVQQDHAGHGQSNRQPQIGIGTAAGNEQAEQRHEHNLGGERGRGDGHIAALQRTEGSHLAEEKEEARQQSERGTPGIPSGRSREQQRCEQDAEHQVAVEKHRPCGDPASERDLQTEGGYGVNHRRSEGQQKVELQSSPTLVPSTTVGEPERAAVASIMLHFRRRVCRLLRSFR